MDLRRSTANGSINRCPFAPICSRRLASLHLLMSPRRWPGIAPGRTIRATWATPPRAAASRVLSTRWEFPKWAFRFLRLLLHAREYLSDRDPIMRYRSRVAFFRAFASLREYTRVIINKIEGSNMEHLLGSGIQKFLPSVREKSFQSHVGLY
jgi:hypothetical protein